MHLIMTCHWFLGSLWFRLTSHQLSASTQLYWVEISLLHWLNRSRLIIPNKVHFSRRRLHAAAIIPYFSQVGDYTIWYGRDVTFLPGDLKSISVNNKVFLVGWLTSANITVIRGETLPDLTMRSWYDMCQTLVLVIIFSFLDSTLLNLFM